MGQTHIQAFLCTGAVIPAIKLRYQTIEFDTFDIHICSLRDRNQFSDDDGEAAALGVSSAFWPLFGLLWDSGRLLAELMVHHDIEGRRILEVGCGLGLASFVLQHRKADITATDLHPEACNFLRRNASLNEVEDVPFVRADWASGGDGLDEREFDLIIGSDLLYERSQVSQLDHFIDQHAAPRCEVILIDPGRGQHTRFSHAMAARGYAHSHRRAPLYTKGKTAHVLTYRR